MITTHKYKTLTWVDLESPVVEDIKILMQQYNIPPIVADELLKPTIRPKADIYGNIVYLILHFPIYDISRKVSEPCEVDFILGKNFIITAHYKSIIPLHELVKIFEVGILLKENHFAKSVGRLTFLITKKLYDYALRQLEHIHNKISDFATYLRMHLLFCLTYLSKYLLAKVYDKAGKQELANEQYEKASLVAGDSKPMHEALLKEFEKMKLGGAAARERAAIKRIEEKEKFEKGL